MADDKKKALTADDEQDFILRAKGYKSNTTPTAVKPLVTGDKGFDTKITAGSGVNEKKPTNTSKPLSLNIKKEETKNKPSLSNYNEPELMPMREKVILSKKDQKAKELVVNSARKYGATLDIGNNPLYDFGNYINKPKNTVNSTTKTPSIEQSAKNLQSDNPEISAKGFTDLKGKAPQQEVPKIDSKLEMDEARKQRKARWGDALTALGRGMQGKSIDTDNFETSKIERKRDERFQEYKDITSNNKKVKEVWDAKNRDELIKFLETQKKSRDLNEKEEAKLNDARFYKEQKEARDAAEHAAKMKSGYYNKRTSSTKADPPIKLPLESEYIINEMNELTGGASEAKTKRNQQRLNDLLTEKPESYKTLVEMSQNLAKLRKQIDAKQKAYNEAIKSDDAVNAPKYQTEIDSLTAQLDEYQNNIKTILNGQTTEAETTETKTPTTLGKGSLDNL